MKKIELTQGKFALVSDEDYEYLNQWSWHVSKGNTRIYAVRGEYLGVFDGVQKYKHFKMHRVVAERAGLSLDHQIDHIDRDGLNNQRDNLRSVTNKQNQENQALDRRNTSGYRGVSYNKSSGKWAAYIRHNYKLINLGRYVKIEDAVKARKEAEMRLFTHA